MHSRKSSWVFFAVVAVLCALILRGAWVYRAPDDETVTVSPETTGIVEPLRADGSVDYAAATRRVLSDGATAETNAAIPLIRAAGPRCIERPLRASIRAEVGEGLADCLAAIVASNTRGEVVGSVATAMELDLTRLALALARWKARRGTYPDVLDDLVPDLVPTLAADAFKGAPLRYRREEEGYALWSVGPNGRDDGGEDGRDLVFRAKR